MDEQTTYTPLRSDAVAHYEWECRNLPWLLIFDKVGGGGGVFIINCSISHSF